MTNKRTSSTSSAARFMFAYFSYVDHLIQSVINVLPPFLRTIIFKCVFRKFGKRNLVDYGTYFRYPNRISIGSDVSINRGCQFYPSLIQGDGTISLADRVVVGPNVVFFAAGQDPREKDLPDIGGSITVEKDAYIGGNSTIRYGVTIGEGAVVAAGSVVVSDVAPYSVVAGVPARTIQKRLFHD